MSSETKAVECELISTNASKVWAKPPTILVFTNDNNEFFSQIYSSLNKVLPVNTYSILHISSKSFTADPWHEENVASIIITNQEMLNKQILAKLENCLTKRIKLLSNTPNKEKNFVNHVVEKIEENGHCIFSSNSVNYAITYNMEPVKFVASFNTSLLCESLKLLGFEIKNNQEVPDLTHGYFICQPDNLVWDMEGLEYGSNIGNSPKLLFESITNKNIPSPTPLCLPIKVCRQKAGFPDTIAFNTKLYYETLKTKCIGRALLYISVTTTTMDISKSLRLAMPNVNGITVVAGYQTNGIGRSGNQWLSPKGCSLFSFNYNVNLSSILGSNATFIQLILAVSICDAICSLLDLPNFPIKIKWPNDIYYNRQYKLGGIMITSSMFKGFLQCVIGAGINVSNSNPTACINDLLPPNCDRKLSTEEVVAETLNKFEYYTNMFENNGKDVFLRHYYNFWLHSNEEVKLQHLDSNVKETVVIKGLDEYGYLEVQSKQTVFSVHDNGNTFDMMKGLIRPKYHS